jgi:hypothetical protein
MEIFAMVNRLSPRPTRRNKVVLAHLTGSTTCTAAGITVTNNAPVLSLCRRLLEAGHDPATRLDVYRGTVLALTVRSIGEAAQLEINSKGTDFVRHRDVRAASPMRKSGSACAEGWTDWPAATARHERDRWATTLSCGHHKTRASHCERARTLQLAGMSCVITNCPTKRPAATKGGRGAGRVSHEFEFNGSNSIVYLTPQ